MQSIAVIGFFGFLVWIIMQFGIEHALAVGTVISGIVWLLYRLSHKDYEKGDILPVYAEYARSFWPIFLLVLLLRAFIVEPFRIPSGSMMPTLLVGDFILVNKFDYGIRLPVTKTKIIELNQPERGDVVVFRYPLNPRMDYIKRLVGLPGDQVSYSQKHLFINGEPVMIEPIGRYQAVGSGMRAQGYFHGTEDLKGVQHSVLVNPRAPDYSGGCNFLRNKEIVIPDGYYLMVGDNRDDSNDGRCWGLVPEENLVGKAFFIWLNFDAEAPGFVDWSRIGTIIK